MNYVEQLRQAIMEELPGLPDALLDNYTLIAQLFGAFVGNEEVHDAWSVWCNAANLSHPSLIPYHELSKDKQDLDTKYTKGIVRAVKKVKGH